MAGRARAAEAIERGILAGFEIDVLEIRDPSPILGESEDARRGRRLALLQTALLEHAAAHNLHTVMTFHQRVEEAAEFAARLPETAAELYVTEASEEALARAEALPKSSIDAKLYELEADRHVPPNRVWSAWLCGDHLVTERREVLRQFANGIDATGHRVHRAFLTSVRVLGEGVDITGERGVEAVCFADTRGSQVEIVQNIGRALRLNKDGTTKIARISVPVFLEAGEDPKEMVASASFAPLVAVLQGLRSHDEHLVEQLASRALTSGKRKLHIRRDEDGRILGAGGAGDSEDQEDGADAAAESALLHFSSPRDAATIAAFLRTRVYRPESLVWLEGDQALIRWRAENGITDLYGVPYDTETMVGVTTAFPLGRWVHQQRKALRTGELEDRRKTLLDAPEAGMVWEPGEEAWETKLAVPRSFRQTTGHLAPRQDAMWGEEDDEMVPFGQYMANLRRKGAKNGLGKNEDTATTRAAQLAAIDKDWNCPWPLDWQRQYRVLADLVDADGQLPDSPGRADGRRRHRTVAPAAEAAGHLGVPAARAAGTADLAGRTAQPGAVSRPLGRSWGEGAEHGTAGVPARPGRPRAVGRAGRRTSASAARARREIVVEREPEPVTVSLGVWVSNTKTRRDKLTPDQLDALRELGVDWA